MILFAHRLASMGWSGLSDLATGWAICSIDLLICLCLGVRRSVGMPSEAVASTLAGPDTACCPSSLGIVVRETGTSIAVAGIAVVRKGGR